MPVWVYKRELLRLSKSRKNTSITGTKMNNLLKWFGGLERKHGRRGAVIGKGWDEEGVWKGGGGRTW